jgi:hypothetical protein
MQKEGIVLQIKLAIVVMISTQIVGFISLVYHTCMYLGT